MSHAYGVCFYMYAGIFFCDKMRRTVRHNKILHPFKTSVNVKAPNGKIFPSGKISKLWYKYEKLLSLPMFVNHSLL